MTKARADGTLDWLIVGGGPQGRFVARALRRAAPAAAVAVMDPRAALTLWRRRADACGMTFLRSTGAHHLGQEADSLRAFAARRGFGARHRLGRYRRPSRALFEAHAERALAGLPWLQARAAAVTRAGRFWSIHAADGRCYRARRVVLALGPNAPYRPPWGAGAEHVYDPGFELGERGRGERVLVVGAGSTGAQLTLRFAAAGRAVCWVTRGPPRPARFDSDPCYAGRRCLAPFARAPLAARTRLLAAARRPGTLSPEIYARMSAALAAGDIAWRRGEIRALDDAGAVFSNGARAPAERVVLATGFAARPAPEGLLARTLEAAGAEFDAAGHAFITADLAAAPGLYLVGRAASLQLGPMAGNIRGARLAGQKLAARARADAGDSSGRIVSILVRSEVMSRLRGRVRGEGKARSR